MIWMFYETFNILFGWEYVLIFIGNDTEILRVYEKSYVKTNKGKIYLKDRKKVNKLSIWGNEKGEYKYITPERKP